MEGLAKHGTRAVAAALLIAAVAPGTVPSAGAVDAGGGYQRVAETIPKPVPRPDRPGDLAKPDASETAGKGAGAPGADELPAAGEAPIPQPRPKHVAEPADKPDGGKDKKPNLMPPPRQAAMPADELACRVKLRAAGVTFKDQPQLADATGCSVPWPLSISSLSKDIGVAPDAVLSCEAALAAASFMRDVASAKAKQVLGSPVKSIAQASAYVCRPRNGTTKLSEHAFGKALDIGAFMLADGRTVTVGGAETRQEAEFLLAVRLAACGPFATVLGPGSDADHATHFHFDLAKRRSGSLFCQ